MRKPISFLLVLVLCLSLVLGSLPRARAATGDEIRAAKKIISVVYDDSGSMGGERWVYANYAMQALTAQLNAQDELYITYMSQPGTASKVSLSDISGAVSDIRNWTQSGNTPIQAVDTAKDKLDSISESDSAVQFWLVILTDGDFGSNVIQNRLSSFKGSRMSNGSTLNIVYLAMGQGANTASADERKGLYTYHAKDTRDINDAMAEIANLVSSRIRADKLKQVDDTTVSFRSDLPLYSISVLTQQSTASVVSAKSSENTLNVNRNIGLDASDPFYYSSAKLFGNAAVINLTDGAGTSSVIDAGTYTITFSEPVDVKDLVIQYEPAIGLKMKVTRGGVEIQDPNTLGSGEKVNIELIPVIPGTDKEIDSGSLPNGISWSIEYVVDQSTVESKDGNKLTGVVLKEGSNMIRGIMQLPGFAPSVYEIYFKLDPIIYNFGIQVNQPDPLTYYRRNSGDLGVEGGSLTFRVTNDGIPLSKEELKSLDLKLEVADLVCDDSAVAGFLHRFGKVPVGCSLKLNDDGSYTLTPNPIVPFTSFLTKAGNYTVTVTLNRDNTVTETGKFTLVAQLSDWVDMALLGGSLLLIAYLIYILFIKYKFAGQTVFHEQYALGPGGIGKYLSGTTIELKFVTGLLNPFQRGSDYKYDDLVFQAVAGQGVLLTRDSIAASASHCTESREDPLTSLGDIYDRMKPTKRVTPPRGRFGREQVIVQVRDYRLNPGKRIYMRSDENSTVVDCFYLN